MSLLSDLLAKIKHLEPKRDVPPVLKNTIAVYKKRQYNQRRFIFFTAFVVIAVISGFLAVYLIEKYLTGDSKYFIEQSRQTMERAATPVTGSRHETVTGQYTKTTEPEHQQQSPSPIDKTVQTIGTKKNDEILIDNLKNITSLSQTKEAKKKKISEAVIPQKPHENIQTIEERKTKSFSQDKPQSEKEDSSEKDLYLYTARNYEMKKDYPNAIASYKNVLKIEPKNFRVMNNIASILIQLNSFEDAKSYSLLSLSYKNDYVPALINYAIASAKLGFTEEAENYLLRALQLEPASRQAIFNIAVLYENRGDYKKAREYYLKLQRLGDMQGKDGIERLKDR